MGQAKINAARRAKELADYFEGRGWTPMHRVLPPDRYQVETMGSNGRGAWVRNDHYITEEGSFLLAMQDGNEPKYWRYLE